MHSYRLTHLKELESESIHILREVASQFDNPTLLFSGGKDSILCFHLARKAFYPAKVPFPLLHVDTGHNFPEAIEFRDQLVKEHGAHLLVGSVQKSIDEGKVQEETGYYASRNKLQTHTLLESIETHKIDCAIGGARRDEEKARAKERVFSHRDDFGQWDPKNQRPELWNLYNGRKRPGEHFRAFPISNWTEMDVWQYILLEKIPIPTIYFSHVREVFERDGVIYANSPFMRLKPEEKPFMKRVRFRTVGDMSCTGAVDSPAATLEEIIEEVASTRTTERGSRMDDKRSEAAMEDRKKEGYF
ncbi:MAG: sulfate adenylyltransferase subunit CysD [Flavobacteriales bacterium]|nr:sulfate adenylyltransferase subunit CysD [Flavobacteriales bacterium]MBP9079023.1 sulfate adenylyltransferase subunit CysD [Flavobacteriales bacterium]